MGEWKFRNVAGGVGGGVAGGLLDQGFVLLSGERDLFSPWELAQSALLGGGVTAASMRGYQKACFTGDMPILSERGSIRADAVRVGYRLWSKLEFDPVRQLALQVADVFRPVAKAASSFPLSFRSARN